MAQDLPNTLQRPAIDRHAPLPGEVEPASARRRFDIAGYVVVIQGASAFIAMLIFLTVYGFAGTGGWAAQGWSSPTVVALMGVAGMCSIAFVATAFLAVQRNAAEAEALDALADLDRALDEADVAARRFAEARTRLRTARAA